MPNATILSCYQNCPRFAAFALAKAMMQKNHYTFLLQESIESVFKKEENNNNNTLTNKHKSNTITSK